NGRGFDGDAALALQVHVVQDLVLELALGDGAGPHEQAVGKRGLSVVNVSDDGEIAYLHGALDALRHASSSLWYDRRGRRTNDEGVGDNWLLILIASRLAFVPRRS